MQSSITIISRLIVIKNIIYHGRFPLPGVLNFCELTIQVSPLSVIHVIVALYVSDSFKLLNSSMVEHRIRFDMPPTSTLRTIFLVELYGEKQERLNFRELVLFEEIEYSVVFTTKKGKN